MIEKQKPKRLSSRVFAHYRWILYVVYVGLFGAIVYSSWRHSPIFGILQTATYGYFFYLGIQIARKFQQVYFDNTYLYVTQKGQELLIPLENVESVEISSLGGVYKVNLYHTELPGNHFYFKTSVWYPLNASAKDKLVDELRYRIDQAKQRAAREPLAPKNALSS